MGLLGCTATLLIGMAWARTLICSLKVAGSEVWGLDFGSGSGLDTWKEVHVVNSVDNSVDGVSFANGQVGREARY